MKHAFFAPSSKRRITAALVSGGLIAWIGLASPAQASDVSTPIGGGVGAAAGAVIGNSVGGKSGAVIGGAVGGAAGAAISTKGSGQTGAVIGGAVGGAAGVAVGQSVGGSTGAVVGAGVGGAAGAAVGKTVTEKQAPASTQTVVHRGKHGKHAPQTVYVAQEAAKRGHPGRGHAYGHHKNKPGHARGHHKHDD